MPQNVYEGMFILDSNRYSRDPEAVVDEVTRLVQQAGGEMLVSRLWEERRLAYPIKGQRRGAYWLTYFRLDSQRLSELERQYELNENVLRSLVLKIDPRLVDALVAHAQNVQPPPAEKSEAAPAAVATDAAEADADNDTEGD